MEDAPSTSYADTKAIDHLAAKPRCSPEQRNGDAHSRQVQKRMPGGDPHARADPPEQEDRKKCCRDEGKLLVVRPHRQRCPVDVDRFSGPQARKGSRPQPQRPKALGPPARRGETVVLPPARQPSPQLSRTRAA